MQKIIGLDIGSYSIKAVEISNHFKSYEISNYYEKIIVRDENTPKEQLIINCMQQLFSENKIKADRIVTALPGQYTSSRILSFNFSDHKKIEAAVYSELEDVVPYNIDDMIVDYQIIGTLDNKTLVLAVMTRKEFIGNFLDKLQKINIDPKLIDIDSLSFYNLSPYLNMQKNKCYGIVDIGHEKTSICFVQNGVLRMFRSINLGGRYLTDFIARDLEVSFSEAEKLKHKVSTFIVKNDKTKTQLSEQDQKIAERMTVAANPISRELGRTLYAFKSWEKAPVETLFLSGGTSLIHNMDHYLEEQLGTKIFKKQLTNSSLQINLKLKSKISKMSQGIAIGLRAVSSLKGQSQINVRKDEFAYIQDYESLFKQVSSIVRLVALLLIVLTLTYSVKYFVYSEETNKIQSQYKKEIASIFPKLKRKFSSNSYSFDRVHKESVQRLKNAIDINKNANKNFVLASDKSGSLVGLSAISKYLPKEIKVNIVEYKYVFQSVQVGYIFLRVEADSFDILDKFEETIKKIPSFSETVVKSSSAKPGSDLKLAEYEIKYKPLNL